MLSRFQRWRSISQFNKNREGFYDDVAEAIQDKESIKLFLLNTKAHLDLHNQSVKAIVYSELISKLSNDASWKFCDMLSGIVPQSDMLILAANDKAGSEEDLVEGFRFLANSIRNMKVLKSTVLKALYTPMLVFPVMITFLLIIALNFIPENESILSHEHWLPRDQVLYWISYAIIHFGFYILAGVLALSYLYWYSFGAWRGELRVKFERIPVIGTPYVIYRDYNAANFLTALASLLKAKVDLVSALESLKENSSMWMAWHINRVLDNLRISANDPTNAFDTGLLSPEIHLRLSNFVRRKQNFHEGVMRIGIEGIQYVNKEVEKSSIKLNVASLLLTVIVVLSLQITNLSISYTINRYMKQEIV